MPPHSRVLWTPRAVSEDAKSLVRGLLTLNERKRLTADEALAHRWLAARRGVKPEEVVISIRGRITTEHEGRLSASPDSVRQSLQ